MRNRRKKNQLSKVLNNEIKTKSQTLHCLLYNCYYPNIFSYVIHAMTSSVTHVPALYAYFKWKMLSFFSVQITLRLRSIFHGCYAP